MIVNSTNTVCVGTKRDCQCHKYYCNKDIFLRVSFVGSYRKRSTGIPKTFF